MNHPSFTHTIEPVITLVATAINQTKAVQAPSQLACTNRCIFSTNPVRPPPEVRSVAFSSVRKDFAPD